MNHFEEKGFNFIERQNYLKILGNFEAIIVQDYKNCNKYY